MAPRRIFDQPFTDKERLRFSRMLRRDPDTGCLLFTGTRSRKGHGLFRIGSSKNGSRRLAQAHLVAWAMAGRQIGAAQQLTHHCPGGDRANCCELTHLKPMLPAEHKRDRMLKDQERKSRFGFPRNVKKTLAGTYYAYLRLGGTTWCLGTYRELEQAAAVAAFVRGVALGVRFLVDSQPLTAARDLKGGPRHG